MQENGATHDPRQLSKVCSSLLHSFCLDVSLFCPNHFFFFQLNYNALERLCRDRMIMETLLASPSVINQTLVPSIIGPLLKRSDKWAAMVPPMLFPPPRLGDAVKEVIF